MGKQRFIFIKDDRVKLYRSETNYIYDGNIYRYIQYIQRQSTESNKRENSYDKGSQINIVINDQLIFTFPGSKKRSIQGI